MDLSSKVAIVTGGASGIGLSIVKELLKNGAKGIAMVDCNKTVGMKALQSVKKEFGEESVIFLCADISQRDSFEESFKTTLDTFQQIDIVVNNAGIMNDVDYSRCIETNLIGTAHGITLGLKYMNKNKGYQGGIIVNISSIAVWEMLYTCPTYSATKTGIVNLTRGYGHPYHYDKTGVKVIALCPGATITPIHANCKFLDGCFSECIKNILKSGVYQLPDVVARCLVYILKKGETTQVYLSDGNKLYLIDEPNLKECKKLVLNHI